jgi:protein-tyrosine-phosphatase/glycosyltransferase involved in cell wall biosynthesis
VRILWVKVGGLWPPNTGGRLRSFHLLAELARRHRVILATTHAPDTDPAALAGALPGLEEIVSVPFAIPGRRSPRFAAALLRSWLSPLPVDLHKFRVGALAREVERRLAAGGIDLCVADFLSATVNVPLRGPVPVVFFAHNVEHLIWKRLAAIERRPHRRLLLGLEWRKMRRAEARACARARLTLAVSEADCDLLAALAPPAVFGTVPTGVDTTRFVPAGACEEPGRLVFVGSMDWLPNEDAALYFIEAILPRVRRMAPQARLVVVGRNPSPRLLAAAAAAGVRVTGTVEDVRPHLAAAAVCVVPLRVGGGTRLKIFEALAMGKAVVSTTIGAEGLPLQPGIHYVRADDPDRFAVEVVALLREPGRRRSLGEAGCRLVRERYSWPQVARVFETRCAEAALSGAFRAAPGARALAAPARRRLPQSVRRHLRASLRFGPRVRRTYWRLLLRRAIGGNGGAPEDSPARTLLFVCHGNVIRSPMAEALARRSLAALGAGGFSVLSAGLHAERGRDADGRAQMAAAEFGVSLRDHRARPLTRELALGADLIFAMDSLNQAELLARYPEAAPRIRLVGEGVAARRGRPVEIEDPFLGSVEDVRRCYGLLETCVRRQAERFARVPRRPPEEGARHAG